MKATVDLPEELLAEVRLAAERRGWKVRVVFEESLRAFLEKEDAAQEPKPFRLSHSVVRGEAFPEMSFAQMLEATGPDRMPE